MEKLGFFDPICDANGKMNVFENFFCYSKAKYRILTKNLLQPNKERKKSGKWKFLESAAKIFLLATVIIPIIMLIGKLIYRLKNRFEILPEKEKYYSKKQYILTRLHDPKAQAILQNVDNKKATKKYMKAKFKEWFFDKKEEYIKRYMALNEEYTFSKESDESAYQQAWERLKRLNEELKQKTQIDFFEIVKNSPKRGEDASNPEEYFRNLLDEGNCAGLTKVLNIKLRENPELTAKEISDYLQSEPGKTERFFYQMIELVRASCANYGENNNGHRIIRALSNKKMILEDFSFSLNSMAAAKSLDVSEYEKTLKKFEKQNNPKNAPLLLNLMFKGKSKPSRTTQHAVFTQYSPSKGYRFFDQEHGISQFLSRKKFCKLLKHFMLVGGVRRNLNMWVLQNGQGA